VSLILEALKKLEREKRSAEPGFLVLGPTSWPSAPGGGRRAALALAGFALLAAVLALMGWRGGRQPSPAGPRQETAAAPVPPVVTAPLPPTIPPSPPAAAIVLQPEPQAATAASEPLEPQHAAAPARVESAGQPAAEAIAPEPAPSPAEPAPRFRLQAISQRDGKPVAVLDGRLVYEGESFEGIRVVRIGETEVELEVDGRRLVVGF
jgi:hypothetical protein